MQKDNFFMSPDLQVAFLTRKTVIGTVLVCEDNQTNQLIIAEGLDQMGVPYLLANDGLEAVEVVRRRKEANFLPFDLILMDIHMPHMDGIEAAHIIKKSGCLSPIVAMSAGEIGDSHNLIDQNGEKLPVDMVGCLPKPFSREQLWNCLNQYLTVVESDETPFSLNEESQGLFKMKRAQSFIKYNQSKGEDIEAAINSCNFSEALRLAHSLKGVAGMMNLNHLHFLAAKLEQTLQNNRNSLMEDMLHLKHELSRAVTQQELELTSLSARSPRERNGI